MRERPSLPKYLYATERIYVSGRAYTFTRLLFELNPCSQIQTLLSNIAMTHKQNTEGHFTFTAPVANINTFYGEEKLLKSL